jgi:hypothetical protein
MRFQGKRDELERRLRQERPQPNDDLVSRLAQRVTPEPVRRRGWSLALAVSFTGILVVAFAATGGVGYAGSAVKGGTNAVTNLVTGDSNSHKFGNSGKSGGSDNAGALAAPSNSQGDHKQAVCHVPPGNPDNANTIVIDDSAVETHLDHGDSLGPCPEDGGPPDDQYAEKVLICHIPPGNPENAHTLSVSVNAVPAHLAHGDTEGPCPED